MAKPSNVRIVEATGMSVAVSNFPASDSVVTVTGYVAPSTTVAVSNFPAQSTQVSLGTSPSVKLFDSTGGGLLGSTKMVNQGVNALVVREAALDCTTASGQASSAGDNTLLSSAATSIYVYAYALSALSTAAQLIRFLNGSTNESWRVRIQGGSTVGNLMMTSELAVTPPAYLFRTAAGNGLLLNVTSSGVNYAVSAWRE